MKHYILEDKTVKEVDLMTWATWFEDNENRRIAYSDFTDGENKFRVSTVFLGIDHSFGIGPELLYETMVFDSGTEMDGEPYRYSTYEEAEHGHEETVKKVKKLLKLKN